MEGQVEAPIPHSDCGAHARYDLPALRGAPPGVRDAYARFFSIARQIGADFVGSIEHERKISFNPNVEKLQIHCVLARARVPQNARDVGAHVGFGPRLLEHTPPGGDFVVPERHMLLEFSGGPGTPVAELFVPDFLLRVCEFTFHRYS